MILNIECTCIVQGLFKTWKQERKLDTNTCKVAPFEYYIKFQYTERYVKLCARLGVEPIPFVEWLRKPISSMI